MKITFLGHASLHIEVGGKHLVVDPFITGNPLNSVINIETLQADYILITHAHQDHILDVQAIGERTGATIISSFEIVSHFEKIGLKGHPMNHGATDSEAASVNLKKSNSITSAEEQADGSIKFPSSSSL